MVEDLDFIKKLMDIRLALSSIKMSVKLTVTVRTTSSTGSVYIKIRSTTRLYVTWYVDYLRVAVRQVVAMSPPLKSGAYV